MPPLNPAVLQMLASLGGPGGPGGPGGMPSMGGPPQGGMPMMGGGPPGMPAGPAGGDPLGQIGQEGMDALDGLVNGAPNGELRTERAREGLDVVHKIILALLPIVGAENMELSKQLHVIGRQVADVRINLSKENEAGVPPEAMISGVRGTGLPGAR